MARLVDSICGLQFDDTRRPILLWCGHTMCDKCLKTHTSFGYVKCPECKRKFESNKQPVNYLISSMLGSEDQVQGENNQQITFHEQLESHKERLAGLLSKVGYKPLIFIGILLLAWMCNKFMTQETQEIEEDFSDEDDDSTGLKMTKQVNGLKMTKTIAAPSDLAPDVSHRPWGVGISTLNGDVIVSDSNHNSMYIRDKNYKLKLEFGGKGTTDGLYRTPRGIAVSQIGRIYISDQKNNRIQIHDKFGRFLDKFGSQGSDDGELDQPKDLAIGDNGKIYICDSNNFRVSVFQPDHTYHAKIGPFKYEPIYIAVSPNMDTIVVDSEGIIYIHNSNHILQRVISTGKSGILSPLGVVTDKFGNIFIAEAGYVITLNKEGDFISKLAVPELQSPKSVAVNSRGSVLVTDSSSGKIFVFKPWN